MDHLDVEMKSGSSKRKPAVTRRILEKIMPSDRNELIPPAEVKQEPLDSEYYANNFEAVEENLMDDCLKTECDGGSRPLLPEGTVVVVPEPVKALDVHFNGPELQKLSNKIKASEDLEKLIVCCTACSNQVNHKISDCIFEHPLLGVLLCKKCKNFYNSGSFSKDENGVDEYCRWCAEGGKLICCDCCTNAFCEGCIRRNLGRSFLARIVNADVWHCFVCDPVPLLELRAFSQLVIDKAKERKGKHSDTRRPRPVFTSPSEKMDPKTGLETCLENTVHVSRYLREESQALHRKVAATKQSDVGLVIPTCCTKLKKLLVATKEYLDIISRAVDRETSKCSNSVWSSRVSKLANDFPSDSMGKVETVATIPNESKAKDENTAFEGLVEPVVSLSTSSKPSLISDQHHLNLSESHDDPFVNAVETKGSLPHELQNTQVYGDEITDDEKDFHLNRDPLLSSTPISKSVSFVGVMNPEKDMAQEKKLSDIFEQDDAEVVRPVIENGGDSLEKQAEGIGLSMASLTKEVDDGFGMIPAVHESDHSSILNPNESGFESNQEDSTLLMQARTREEASLDQKEIGGHEVEKKQVKIKRKKKRSLSEENRDTVPNDDEANKETMEFKRVHADETMEFKRVHADETMEPTKVHADEVIVEPKKVHADEVIVEPKKVHTDEVIVEPKNVHTDEEAMEWKELQVDKESESTTQDGVQISSLSNKPTDNMVPSVNYVAHDKNSNSDENFKASEIALRKSKGRKRTKNKSERRKLLLDETDDQTVDEQVLPISDNYSTVNISPKSSPREEVTKDCGDIEGFVEKSEDLSPINNDDCFLPDVEDDRCCEQPRSPVRNLAKPELQVKIKPCDFDPTMVDVSKTDLASEETKSILEPNEEMNDKDLVAKVELLKSLQSDDFPTKDEQIIDSPSVDENEKTQVYEKGSKNSPNKVSTISQRSRLKTTPRKQKANSKDKRRRSGQLFSSSSTDSSSDEEHNTVSVITPMNAVKQNDIHDPKLKGKAVVVLKRLSASVLLELQVTGCVKVKPKQKRKHSECNSSSAESRAVARMSNFKLLKGKRKKWLEESENDSVDDLPAENKVVDTKEKDEKKSSNTQNSNHKKSKIRTISSSSEEDSDVEPTLKSSLNEDELKNDKNSRAKALLKELLKDSDDEDEEKHDDKSNSDKSDKAKSQKRTVVNVKPLVEDDDSDVQPVVKKGKRFNSPLLRASLGSSDSDSSIAIKTTGRRAKRNTRAGDQSDSDASVKSSSLSSSSVGFSRHSKKWSSRRAAKDNSTDESQEQPKKRTKRRRIKEFTDSSVDSDDDVCIVEEKSATENTTPGKSRKNIRKLITDAKLRDDTKFAAREEEERRRRVAELQALYNEVIERVEGQGPPVTKRLVLAKDLSTNEALVEVNPDLIQKLKPHQVDGVKFLWECVCESLDRLHNSPGSGCLIAHCMGLGKTLQVITFLHAVLTSDCTRLKTALVVCPLNTVMNWYYEFRAWLDEIEPEINVVEMSSFKSYHMRASVLRSWLKNGGVVIIGYEMFRCLVQEKGKRIPRSCRVTFQETLIAPGPDIVVCDEGHILKNCNSAISKAMNRISSKRRIVLTGTPLQNNLAEYHCMVSFVKPKLLGTLKEFQNRFVNPIQNGQCADSTAGDVRLMKRRAHILHNVLDGCVQRRDYSVLTPFLPPKHEFVISIRLTEAQVKIYTYYLENFARRSGKNSLFADYQSLLKIWTHPYIIRLSEIREENKAKFDSEDSFIDDGSLKSSDDDNSIEVICDDGEGEPSTSKRKAKGAETSDDEVVNNWKSRRRGGKENDNQAAQPLEAPEAENTWWMEFVPEDMERIDHSGKLVIVFDILKECYAIGDKVLLFSQSLLTLDFLEELLRKTMGDNAEGKCDRFYCGNWINGVDYFRLDGSTSAEQRTKYMRIFNDKDNLMARLFLISTRAGSLGINLVAANRVIMLDASWNPTHDVQSIFRVYRFGQDKPVYIYRLLAQGTMEEKIYDRQVTKQSLACRVIDEQQIERHFSFADLQELYTLNLDNVSKRPTPMVPKDRLLAELLIKHKEIITAYHEHDSLLVNQEQEELTEDERSAAWVEYEAEKQGLLQDFGNPVALGFNQKFDIHKIIQDIQQKYPGLSKMDLKAKFHETIALLNSARKQALEQQRQEMIMRHIHAQQQAQLANAQKYSGSALYNYSGSTPLQVQQAAMLQNLILDSRQQQQPPQQHQQQQQQQQVSYTFLS